MLSVTGYDNEISLGQLDESHLHEVETYAKTELIKNGLVEEKDRPKYYGGFAKNPEFFAIVPGHRALVLQLYNAIKQRNFLKPSMPKKSQPKKNICNTENKSMVRKSYIFHSAISSL